MQILEYGGIIYLILLLKIQFRPRVASSLLDPLSRRTFLRNEKRVQIMAKGPFLFDSHALLKFFQKEKGYEKVVKL